jgi:hypothetical protein
MVIQTKESADAKKSAVCGPTNIRPDDVKRQYNSVIIPILDECEKLGWPELILLPKGLEGDVKQAIYHFHTLGVVRLYQVGSGVRWYEKIRPSSF